MSSDDVKAGPKANGGASPSLVVEVSGEMLGMLDHLARDGGTTLDEVIAKSFLLYKEAAEASRRGKAVGVAANPDALETQFVGF
jgi:hypothetical protein